MERLVVYAYWPWGARAPKLRKGFPTKRASVIASGAAPAMLGRLFFATLKGLRTTSRTIGAKHVGDIFVGLAAGLPAPQLAPSVARRIGRAMRALIRAGRPGVKLPLTPVAPELSCRFVFSVAQPRAGRAR